MGKICIYINKDGNASTKSTRHVTAMQTHKRELKETRDHQNSRNEVENVTLKEHPMPKGALVGMCRRDEELENKNA